MPSKNNITNNRRAFLQNSLKAGAALSMLSVPSLSTGMDALSNPNQSKKSSKALKILILGGTSFLGPHQIAYALERGHTVSTFTRGKSKPPIHKELFSQVESLIGDRNDNLEALKGRSWDVVIDNSGRRVKWTQDTAELLKDHADLYMYVSSLSVFFPFTGTDFSENRKPLLSVPEDIVTEENKREYDYGIMKANSELAAIESFGKDRANIVRPTFIVGPADPTDRFNYWPIRLERGGEILVPGKAGDRVQYIDVHDLAAWMIHMCENKVAGTFNASGPGFPITMPAFVHGAHASYNTPASFVYVDDYDFLSEHGVPFICPWVMPTGNYYGMGLCTNHKAIEQGLTFRPLANTIESIQKWKLDGGISEERIKNMISGENSVMSKEAAVLKAWKSR